MNILLKKKRRKTSTGVALFVLMTGIAIMSLLMRELLNTAYTQATRVRNSADRIQALYLARSGLNLARFMLTVDRVTDSVFDKQKIPVADKLDDLWTIPNNFPLAAEEVQLLIQSQDKQKEKKANTPEKAAQSKACQAFFDDFQGNATSITTDLSRFINLNDLASPNGKPTFDVLVELLKPNVEFLQYLNRRNIQPEALAREIRDYVDSDEIENETNTPETSAYTAMQLDYGPKNRFLTNMDELKMLPHMDDKIYDYLSQNVSPYNISPTIKPPPSKINLNTVGKSVFQALLKNSPDAEAIADKFIKDRDEKKRVYTDKDLKTTLHDALQLPDDAIQLNLLTGVSDSFKIETTAVVNRIELKLETVVVRPNKNKVEPIVMMRVSP